MFEGLLAEPFLTKLTSLSFAMLCGCCCGYLQQIPIIEQSPHCWKVRPLPTFHYYKQHWDEHPILTKLSSSSSSIPFLEKTPRSGITKSKMHRYWCSSCFLGRCVKLKLPHVTYERNTALSVDDSNKDQSIFHFLEAYWAAQSIIQRKATQE